MLSLSRWFQPSIPTNLYVVQTGLPWNFRARAKEYISMKEACDQTSSAHYVPKFAQVYELMKTTIQESGGRAPVPLTLEAATALAESQRDGRAIMVVTFYGRVPEGCHTRVPEAKVCVEVVWGICTMHLFNIDWTLDIRKPKKVADRIRATLAAREPTAVVMMYSIWDVEVNEGVFKPVEPKTQNRAAGTEWSSSGR